MSLQIVIPIQEENVIDFSLTLEYKLNCFKTNYGMCYLENHIMFLIIFITRYFREDTLKLIKSGQLIFKSSNHYIALYKHSQ